MEIHQSDLPTVCGLRASLENSYGKRYQFIGSQPSVFVLGRCFHWVMEVLGHNKDVNIDAVIANFVMQEMRDCEPSEELVSIAQTVKNIAGHYVRWSETVQGYFADNNFSFVAAEVPFSVPLKNSPHSIAGRIDQIVRHKDGTYWLVEFKTVGGDDGSLALSSREEYISFEMQSGMYCLAARKMGYPVKGMIYNLIWKKSPDHPTTLKGGKELSKARSLKTTDLIYEDDVLHHYGYIPDDFNHLIDYYRAKRPHFFRREAIVRRDAYLTSLERDLHYIAEDHQMRSNTPVGGPHCKWCQFKDVCMVRMTGGDWQRRLKQDFMEKPCE